MLRPIRNDALFIIGSCVCFVNFKRSYCDRRNSAVMFPHCPFFSITDGFINTVINLLKYIEK